MGASVKFMFTMDYLSQYAGDMDYSAFCMGMSRVYRYHLIFRIATVAHNSIG